MTIQNYNSTIHAYNIYNLTIRVRFGSGGGYNYKGYINEVRIYNRDLSGAQTKTIYEAIK